MHACQTKAIFYLLKTKAIAMNKKKNKKIEKSVYVLDIENDLASKKRPTHKIVAEHPNP